MEDELDMFCLWLSIPYCSCTDKQYKKIPDFVFNIDDTKYFLPKESYIIKEVGKCGIGIMSHPTMQIWILGLNFFANYYTVFDQEEGKVGFAISRYAHPRVLDYHQNTNLYDQSLKIDFREFSAAAMTSDDLSLMENETGKQLDLNHNKLILLYIMVGVFCGLYFVLMIVKYIKNKKVDHPDSTPFLNSFYSNEKGQTYEEAGILSTRETNKQLTKEQEIEML